jgi:hypothetical protein
MTIVVMSGVGVTVEAERYRILKSVRPAISFLDNVMDFDFYSFVPVA